MSSQPLSVRILAVFLVCLTIGVVTAKDKEKDKEKEKDDAARAAARTLQALLEAAPHLKTVNAEYDSEMRQAEEAYREARIKAFNKRLDAYRQQLKVFGQALDTDHAIGCKTAIDAIESLRPEPAKPRPKNTVQFGDHSFALIEEQATWHIAKRRCEAMGGHLAYAKTPEEIDFINKMAGNNIVFLGATDEDVEGTWRWLDGIKWNPNKKRDTDNWNGAQHHLVWDGKRRIVDDAFAGARLFYICEWETPEEQ